MDKTGKNRADTGVSSSHDPEKRSSDKAGWHAKAMFSYQQPRTTQNRHDIPLYISVCGTHHTRFGDKCHKKAAWYLSALEEKSNDLPHLAFRPISLHSTLVRFHSDNKTDLEIVRTIPPLWIFLRIHFPDLRRENIAAKKSSFLKKNFKIALSLQLVDRRNHSSSCHSIAKEPRFGALWRKLTGFSRTLAFELLAHRQLVAAFGSAALEDGSSVFCLHSGAKSVCFHATMLFWLIGAFHKRVKKLV
jgi:hypothetical protein